MKRILVIEDEDFEREVISFGLSMLGYSVFEASSGIDGIEQYKSVQPDAIILDLGLPDLSGFDVIKKVNPFCSTPIIVLTGDRNKDTEIKCYKQGVFHFMIKPYKIELLDSILTSSILFFSKKSDILLFETGRLKIDFIASEAYIDGKFIELSNLQFNILKYLALNVDVIKSNKEIYEYAWGQTFYCQAECVRNQINFIRKKIELNPENPQLLINIPHYGYKLQGIKINS